MHCLAIHTITCDSVCMCLCVVKIISPTIIMKEYGSLSWEMNKYCFIYGDISTVSFFSVSSQIPQNQLSAFIFFLFILQPFFFFFWKLQKISPVFFPSVESQFYFIHVWIVQFHIESLSVIFFVDGNFFLFFYLFSLVFVF